MLWNLFKLALLAALIYLGMTVNLGNRTLFGHIRNIWASEQTRELVDGVKQASGPAVDKVKRGLRVGLDEARRDDPLDAGIQTTQ